MTIKVIKPRTLSGVFRPSKILAVATAVAPIKRPPLPPLPAGAAATAHQAAARIAGKGK
jgi:hypothetical protein